MAKLADAALSAIHPVKYFTKSFLISPYSALSEVRSDLKKDLLSENYSLVWVAGLPKSGTTLIEKVLDSAGYVQGDKSLLRRHKPWPISHDHGVCDGHFRFFPKNKKTFLKTHTHYEDKYIQIALEHSANIIVSVRDLRDVMISRYFHVLSDKNHWQHSHIVGLDTMPGFIASCNIPEIGEKERPVDYYARWIHDWLDQSERHSAEVFWYEEYTNDRYNYLSRLLSTVCSKAKAHEVEHLLEADRIRSSKYPLLRDRRLQAGRKLSTYRAGSSSWPELLDTNTQDWFLTEFGDKNVFYPSKEAVH